MKSNNIKKISEIINSASEIVCYGAGKRLRKLEEIFRNTEVEKKISYIIDRDINKQNTTIKLFDKEVKVISLEEVNLWRHKNVLFIITCADYVEIFNSLKEMDCMKGIDCYCLTHIPAMIKEESAGNKYLPDNFRLTTQPLIPKVIHYCWFGKKELPDIYKRYIETWGKYCPDYKIVQWNEDNYDITKNQYMYQAYQHKKWGFVPDYARLDIIYKYGGIYLDTDVELLQCLDELTYQTGFVGFEEDERVNFGSGFGAVKGLEIMKELRDAYENISFVNESGELNLIPSLVW